MELDDGRATRRRQPRPSAAVAYCLDLYRRLLRQQAHKQTHRAYLLQCRLTLRLAQLTPAETDAYYAGVVAHRVAEAEAELIAWR